jgi:hypothetical protein
MKTYKDKLEDNVTRNIKKLKEIIEQDYEIGKIDYNFQTIQRIKELREITKTDKSKIISEAISILHAIKTKKALLVYR